MSSSDLVAKIRERLRRIDSNPSARELGQLSLYCELLARWNKRVNLTALPLDGFPESTIDVLIAEPVVLARFIPDQPFEWLDLGSGGGSPAIPLKVLAPQASVTLVESRSKKGAFLREVVRALELSNASVDTGRFEELPAAQNADLVTVRAVKMSQPLVDITLRVLRKDGLLALFGKSAEPWLPGFHLDRSVELPVDGHTLHLMHCDA